MNSITSFIQRSSAGLSAHVRAASALVATPVIPAFAGVNPVVGGGTSFGTGMSSNHMHTAWLGDIAETGCVTTTYVTKRITGSLREVLT